MYELDYEKLATAIAEKIKLLPPPDKVIWDGKKCADYLGVSDKHFIDRISKTYGFPSPIKLPSDSGRRGHARWYAIEITDWVSKQKQSA